MNNKGLKCILQVKWRWGLLYTGRNQKWHTEINYGKPEMPYLYHYPNKNSNKFFLYHGSPLSTPPATSTSTSKLAKTKNFRNIEQYPRASNRYMSCK
ncbi:hypothetical protein MKX03_000961 [Papaver bracteatum]|nr:hypothetical protein MKX03_000961 [Papaver bracteatum]